MDKINLRNCDVSSQDIGDTVRKLAAMNVAPGSGEAGMVHAYALVTLAKELVFAWDEMERLDRENTMRDRYIHSH